MKANKREWTCQETEKSPTQDSIEFTNHEVSGKAEAEKEQRFHWPWGGNKREGEEGGEIGEREIGDER